LVSTSQEETLPGYLRVKEPYCRKAGGDTKEIIDRDFKREVLEGQIPVFACFTTRWCHSCYPTCLLSDELANEYEGRVKFVKIDVGKIPRVTAGYRIIAVPTILIFKGSQPVKTLLGIQDRSSLKALLNSVTSDSDKLPGRGLETNEAQG
jgi:thioredoxin 1